MVTKKQKRDWANLPAKEQRENWLSYTNQEDIDDPIKLWEMKTEMTRIDIKEQMEILRDTLRENRGWIV
jgi:hypothetical protein